MHRRTLTESEMNSEKVKHSRALRMCVLMGIQHNTSMQYSRLVGNTILRYRRVSLSIKQCTERLHYCIGFRYYNLGLSTVSLRDRVLFVVGAGIVEHRSKK